MFFFLFLSSIRQLHKLSVSTKVLFPTVTVVLLFFIFSFFFLKKFSHLFKNRKTEICGKSQKLWDRVNTKLRRIKKKGYRHSRKKEKKSHRQISFSFFLLLSLKMSVTKKKNTDSRERRKIVVQYFPVELQTLISNTIIFLN